MTGIFPHKCPYPPPCVCRLFKSWGNQCCTSPLVCFDGVASAGVHVVVLCIQGDQPGSLGCCMVPECVSTLPAPSSWPALSPLPCSVSCTCMCSWDLELMYRCVQSSALCRPKCSTRDQRNLPDKAPSTQSGGASNLTFLLLCFSLLKSRLKVLGAESWPGSGTDGS